MTVTAMKVLFVSSTPTHPTDAGSRARVRQLVAAVGSLGHEVHFAFVGRRPLAVDPAMRASLGLRLHVLEYAPRRTARWAMEHLRRRLQQRLGHEAGWRWSLDAWYDEQLTPRLAALQAREHFDVVVVEYVYLSRAFEAFGPGVRRVLDTHDRFAERHREFVARRLPYAWFSVTEADERRGLARADAVLAMQPQEREAFERLLGGAARVETVGHLFDPAEPVAPARVPAAIVVASGNVLNVEGVASFVREVLPRVRQAEPRFELRLAGGVCEAIGAAPGLVKLGRVSDLAGAYAAAAVAVNPVRGGTGLAIKSLETLAFGVPLVTTRSGARGLEAWPQAYVAVDDDDAAAMAEAILALMADPARAARLTAAGRAAARQFHAAQLHGLQRALGVAA